MSDPVDTMEFMSRGEYRTWLERYHQQHQGIWIVFTKGGREFSAHDALEESICFGWIDGVMKSIDESHYKKYFSSRKDVHKWSQKNRALFEKLVRSGAMTEAGVNVYHPRSSGSEKDVKASDRVKILREALKPDEDVVHLYDGKPPSRQKQLAGFYCEAKTEATRKKRREKIVTALKDGFSGMLY